MALTKAQMAAALQVAYRTITEMMRRQEISYFRIGKRLVRIRLEEALRLMEARGKADAGGATTDGLGWTRISAR